jgi:hypothetical protein
MATTRPAIARIGESQLSRFTRPLSGGVATTGGGVTDEVLLKIQQAIAQLPPQKQQEVERARATIASLRPATHVLPSGGAVRITAVPPAAPKTFRLPAIQAGPATRKAQRDAAMIHALCAVTNNAPAGLPSTICTSGMRGPSLK